MAGAKTVRTAYMPGGWSATVDHNGLCLQSLTCPSATTTTIGKPPLLRATLGTLTGVGATTTVTWTSGSFAYTGAQGLKSRDVRFVGKRFADTSKLLSVAGNSATYTVDVVNARTGATVAEAVRNAALTPTALLTRIGPKRLVNALQKGKSYRLKIVETYSNGADVIPGAVVDFKKCRIVARKHVHR